MELPVWADGGLRAGVGQTTGYGPNLAFVTAYKLKNGFYIFKWLGGKIKGTMTFVTCEN